VRERGEERERGGGKGGNREQKYEKEEKEEGDVWSSAVVTPLP